MSLRSKILTKTSELIDDSGLTLTKTALGFAGISLLAALFFTPILDSSAPEMANGFSNEIDYTTTATVPDSKKSKRYTIRRSVLHADPSKPCYIYEDGTKEGGC